jgi:hypothetical protein
MNGKDTTALATLPLPGEQRDNETAKAHNAFAIYRDLPPNTRSLRRVVQALGKPSGYMRMVEQWSSQHEWGERAVAHDQDVDRRKRERAVSEVVEMNARQATIAAAFEQALTEPLYAFMQAINSEAAREAMRELDPLVLLALTERAGRLWPQVMRAERLARGESTENPSILMTGNAHNQPPDTLERTTAVYEKFAEMGLVPPLADSASVDEG